MHINRYLIICIAMLCTPFVHAQSNLSYGAKLGITSSVFPGWQSSPHPILFPTLGLFGEVAVTENIFIILQYQLQRTGAQFEYKRKSDGLTSRSLNYEYINKFAAPLTAGYTFSNKKIKPAVFVGYNPNFILRGRHLQKYYYNDGGVITSFIRDHNPLVYDYTNATGGVVSPMVRTSLQWTAGIRVNLNQHFLVNFMYSRGAQLRYGIRQAGSGITSGYNFQNQDLELSVQYRFNKLKVANI